MSTSAGLTEKKLPTVIAELQAQIDQLKVQQPAPILENEVQHEGKDSNEFYRKLYGNRWREEKKSM